MSDGILPIPVIPDILREASQRGVVIPFVGAGVSVLAGCPTWADFADGALKACIEAKKFTHGQLAQIRHLPPRVKLSIARGLEEEHGLKIEYAKLINPKNGYENNNTGNRLYRSLGKLGETFVTTNYDSWLDTEIPEVLIPVTAFFPAEHDRYCTFKAQSDLQPERVHASESEPAEVSIPSSRITC
jgi:hypothetical protein